jgi:hypothetical protein
VLCSTSAPATVAEPPAGTSAAQVQRTDLGAAEAVEVRTLRAGQAEEPELLLWRGRLWVVRHAQQVPAGRRAAEAGGRECWRVQVGDGMAGRRLTLQLARLPDGTWMLLDGVA